MPQRKSRRTGPRDGAGTGPCQSLVSCPASSAIGGQCRRCACTTYLRRKTPAATRSAARADSSRTPPAPVCARPPGGVVVGLVGGVVPTGGAACDVLEDEVGGSADVLCDV